MNHGFLPGLKPPPTIPPWMGGGDPANDGLPLVADASKEGGARLAVSLSFPSAQLRMSDFDNLSLHDSTAAFQAAVDSAQVIAKRTGRCQIILDSRQHYYLDGPPTTTSMHHNAQVHLPVDSESGVPGYWIEFVGMPGGLAVMPGDVGSTVSGSFGTTIECTYTGGSFIAANGIQSMFGVASSYRTGQTSSDTTAAMISFLNITLLYPTAMSIAGLDLGWTQGCRLDNVFGINQQWASGTPFSGLTLPIAAQAIGVVLPFVDAVNIAEVGFLGVFGMTVGVVLGQLLRADTIFLGWNNLAVAVDVGGPNLIGHLIDCSNPRGLASYDPSINGNVAPSTTGKASGQQWPASGGLYASPLTVPCLHYQDNNGQAPTGFNRVWHFRDDNNVTSVEGSFLRVNAGSGPTTGIIHTFATSGGRFCRLKDMLILPGFQASPAVPASAVNIRNPVARDCLVQISGGTVTAITIDGTATGLTAGAVLVPANSLINIAYTSAPMWTWMAM